jgi:hypothetical protein
MTLNLTRLKLALGGVLLVSAGIGAGSAFASMSSVDPQIDQEEAMELYNSTGDWGSAALQEYESRYGTLSEEQRQEFLQEEDLYQQRQEERYWEEFKIENPTWDITPIASGKARLKILVNVAKQRLSVMLDGKAVSGLQNIKVSTGKGNSTPKGTFSLARNEITKKRINRTFTKQLGHKVYLEDAIQVKGGIFLHKASTAAQKNTLGRKASHGCVRMDRNKSAKIFTLAKKYRSSAVAVIK